MGGGLGDMGGWMENISSRRIDVSVMTDHLIPYDKKVIREAIQGGQEIGMGGSGTVFSANIGGEQVAIKRIGSGRTAKDAMLTEIRMLGTGNNHPNIIQLYGCAPKPASLVYEYMPNGSLYSHMHDDAGLLTWRQRLSIASNVAEALSYLRGLDIPVVHRDIKSANVLLDNHFNAKLADFGLAVTIQGEAQRADGGKIGVVWGTPGYVPLDDYIRLDYDIYSFGVMLLELIMGRRAFDDSRHPSEHDLGKWARTLPSLALDHIDTRMANTYTYASVDMAFALAINCIGNQGARPEPGQIIARLTTAINL